ncbi:puratrophin-1-like isoform X2 [Haliotis cracherodii]|uniref:puratrophin-1-like isoform X2 n=1 Tax=Haliotis cracherodii TaxID=6455 RepID=UPI0039EB5E9D
MSMWVERMGLGGVENFIRSISQGLANTVLGYFTHSKDSDEPDIQELIASSLHDLYGEAAPTAISQAGACLASEYRGNVTHFLTHFFYPCLEVLDRIKICQLSATRHAEDDWPLGYKGAVIVHIYNTSDQEQLAEGEFLFCVCTQSRDCPCLVLRYQGTDGVHEYLVLESEYREVFTMDWVRKKPPKTEDQDWPRVLRNCLAIMEEKIQRLRWEEVAGDMETEDSGSCASASKDSDISGSQEANPSSDSAVVNDFSSASVKDGGSSQSCSRHSSSGSLSSNGYHTKRDLDCPRVIMDLDYDLLRSGVAILPGSRDVNGGAVVFIFTGSMIWHNRQVLSVELAKLLMYYHSVPRPDAVRHGMTLVADIRGSTSSIINTLLESLYIFQDNIPDGMAVVHLMADRSTQSLVFKSPVYDPHAGLKLDLILSQDLIHRFVALNQLPFALDGNFNYSHDEWVRFRMKLEPFLADCREVAKYLVQVMQDLSSLEKLPRTTHETSQLIEQHEHLVKKAFDDPRLVVLQHDGETTMSSLRRNASLSAHSDDYKCAMETINTLFRQLQDTMRKLVKMAETRLNKLEQCLQLREFEEECTKLISWTSNDGSHNIQRHACTADNLKAARIQQKDFEKFYFSAMKHIEKGNDMLEEASMLTQTGNEVTGYKDLARMLKKHLQQFTSQLEATRERIEGTAQCYHLLDKSYEWALEAMKYVASMRMEHCASPDGLDKLLKSLDAYLKEHPPLTEDAFLQMINTAQKLHNDKLLEQCRVAKARCEETYQLLLLRQNTLKRAKDQLVIEQAVKSSSPKSVLKQLEDNSPVWEPQTTSTPYRSSAPSHRVHVLDRRSESSNSCNVSLASSRNRTLDSDSESRDKSVHSARNSETSASLPVSPTSDHSSSDSGSVSDSKLLLCRTISQPLQGPGSTFSSHNRPIKKMLKRASTAPNIPPPINSTIYEDAEHNAIRDRRSGKSISMITGSSESLPSMPEEDEDDLDVGQGVEVGSMRKEWTPIPVNTHLLRQTRGTPTGSMADLRLSEAEMKNRRTLSLITSEMIQTERDYVRALQFIIDNYIPELDREDVPQALRGKRNVIFGNIENIYQFHNQHFLREVETCETNPFLIGQYFLRHETQFYLYALYNKNKPKSDSLMGEYGKYFFRQKQMHLGDKMDLASYLLKPVQRMGKYALLLKQILKVCPETELEYPDLKAAEEMVKFQLRHGNDLLAMDSLRECDVNLQEQGRLLRQDEFLVWQGRKKSLRRVFLFEDLILFSKTKRGRQGHHDIYVYKYSFKTSDLGLTENYGDSGYKFEIWFRRRSLGENYILQAQSSDVKRAWVRDISKMLWKQAIKNREMATMGVGSKPCLDLKPSADNIQDRFINVALGSRGSRTRNSIAVSSFEHLRNGNKRPHSIISVSSTSSSNSSHSSFGLFGSLNLAFDPLDSPRYQRRSVTFLSNESGIGTDISSGEADPGGGGGTEGGKPGPEDLTPVSSARSYIDYMKSRVFKQNYETVVTDV